MTVRVVTDSACDLSDRVAETMRIEIVPLSIRFGDEELVDREQLSPEDFWSRLRSSPVLPETSAPSAGQFEARFRHVIERGATGIICPIVVIDSRTVSMGLGALCLTAARRAADGARLEEIVEDVLSRRDRTRLFGALDTLEYLKKGGRIGNARALLGSVLSIKPIVEVRDGAVEEAGKVRTRSKALALLADRARAQKLDSLAVLHGQADDVDDLLDRLSEFFPRDEIVTGLVGPVIGTHAGPGVIGVSFQVAR
jgi:fatty acid-binding protein DegV